MKRLNAAEAIDTADGAFADNGSQFRKEQLEVIWQVFGLTSSVVPDGRLYPLIGELVEHRHAIAHGRNTPEETGRRLSKEDILKKITPSEVLCLYIIAEPERHCALHANLIRRRRLSGNVYCTLPAIALRRALMRSKAGCVLGAVQPILLGTPTATSRRRVSEESLPKSLWRVR
jgi:hypothetical protein